MKGICHATLISPVSNSQLYFSLFTSSKPISTERRIHPHWDTIPVLLKQLCSSSFLLRAICSSIRNEKEFENEAILKYLFMYLGALLTKPILVHYTFLRALLFYSLLNFAMGYASNNGTTGQGFSHVVYA